MRLVSDYLSLLKLRVVLLLDATAVSHGAKRHGHPNGKRARGARRWDARRGRAHAINCWFDRDIDGAMNRTRRRPLPQGRIPPWHALASASR
jgi:protoheme IX farnesyltransferase